MSARKVIESALSGSTLTSSAEMPYEPVPMMPCSL